MKVRCIDDCDIDIGQITNGKVYDVLKEGGLGYLIIDDLNIRKYLRKDRFEIVKEENKMKKTFREVIADIKEGEVWECISPIHWNVKEIRYINDEDTKGIEIEFKEETEMYCFREDKEILFRLKRKEYSFDEAFKAYEEGKEIESSFSGQKFKICSWEDFFNTKEIKSKWYIND